jgi:UDP-glucuronate 4-epimerase
MGERKIKTILVTGGAGFIGSHVCDALLLKDYKVVCIDNFNNYYDEMKKKKNIKHNLTNKDFKLYYLDIKDKFQLKKIFIYNDIDAIIHIAAKAGVRYSVEHPQEFQDDNNKATMNMLEMARDFKVENFIFASSSSVYGNGNRLPSKETDKVDTPISPYAASKKSCELMAHAFSDNHSIPVTCLRFFTVYGPRGRPDMAPYGFIDKIWNGETITRHGDGNSYRDYTYISDIVGGIISSLEAPTPYEVINLGNSNPIKLNKFIGTVEYVMGADAEQVVVEMPRGNALNTHADITKAKKLLGYKPKVKLKEGLSNLFDWYIDNEISN